MKTHTTSVYVPEERGLAVLVTVLDVPNNVWANGATERIRNAVRDALEGM